MRSLIGYFSIPLITLGLANCAGYTPGAKGYWDAQVKERCDKDGGVVVLERVALTRDEFKRLGGLGGAIPIPFERQAPSNAPYVRREFTTTLNESSPVVVRSETVVVRRLDGKVLGRSVRYWRTGGDLPTGIIHDSSFICPKHVDLSSQIFFVSEN